MIFTQQDSLELLNCFITDPVKQNWSCRIIEHELSARYNIAHGHDLAILLSSWLKIWYSIETQKEYECFARNVFNENLSIGSSCLSEIFSKLFFCDFGLKPISRDLGILLRGEGQSFFISLGERMFMKS